MKILLIDIETAPNIAHVWGLWQQNVGLPQLIESGYTLFWTATWLGSNKEILFRDKYCGDMLTCIHSLMDEADAIVHYNGTKFDIPTLNKEFVINGMSPPAPSKNIDLLRVVRNQFRFPSNKLAYIAPALGLTPKVKNIGYDLWLKCMEGNKDAWVKMKEYNMGDVLTLEELYYKLRPWIKNHPNQSIETKGEVICPTCGGTHFHKRGIAYTTGAKYQRYQCQVCSTWFRGIKNEGTRSTALA